MTERVGIRELRQNLSKWIRRVQEGESFEVTERGRTVAALVPPLQAQDPAIARLVAEGRIARVGRGSFDDLAIPDAPPGARPLSELLDEMREDEI
ncbi:MAG TPA: type II toxin-antitoxin system prevent-host-death family antitoxin [Gaiellaceae bacterium]|nr:type II toxin-antitoxin system prevent-host-death family antitoxin [Gaiellaceae bacterium]